MGQRKAQLCEKQKDKGRRRTMVIDVSTLYQRDRKAVSPELMPLLLRRKDDGRKRERLVVWTLLSI